MCPHHAEQQDPQMRLIERRKQLLGKLQESLVIQMEHMRILPTPDHDFHTVDRLDPFFKNIHPDLIKNYREPATVLPKKLREHIYGMDSYMFSSKMQFSFASEFFEDNRASLTEAAKGFLKSLQEETIYKCMVIGITDEGDIKSPTNGAFYLSNQTRPEYLVMKMKSGIMHFAFKYRGLDFAN